MNLNKDFSGSVNDNTLPDVMSYSGMPSITAALSGSAEQLTSGVEHMKGFASQAFSVSAEGVKETLSLVNSALTTTFQAAANPVELSATLENNATAPKVEPQVFALGA